MRLLITNDDGAQAPGLFALVQALQAIHPQTVAAAPVADCSGRGTSVRLDGLAAANGWAGGGPAATEGIQALVATPALIALGGCSGAFGPVPDVLVAGINYGPNVGRAILHSGTVGAALTAAVMGVSAVAINLDDVYSTGGDEDGYMYWETAATVAPLLVEAVARAEPGTVVNVNVPNRALADVAGVRAAVLAGPEERPMFGLDEEGRRLRERPGPYYSPSPDSPGTDVSLLAAGYITVAPLGLDRSGLAYARRTARQVQQSLIFANLSL